MELQKQKTLVDLLNSLAENPLDQTAYVFIDAKHGQSEVSYKSLFENVKTIASNLQNIFPRSNYVLLHINDNYSFIQALLACLYTGIVPIVIPFQKNPEPLFQKITSDIKISAIISDDLFFPTKGEIKEILFSDLLLNATKHKPVIVEPSELALIQFSSGSTSDPKGIQLTHANFMANLHYLVMRYGKHCFSVGCCWTPIQHDMGLVGAVLLTLFASATTVIMEPSIFMEDAANWLKYIDRYKVSFTFSPNFAFERCLSLPPHSLHKLDLSSWLLAVNGGEAIHADTVTNFQKYFSRYRLNEQVINPCYGLAESTMVITAHPQSSPLRILYIDSRKLENGIISIISKDEENAVPVVSCGHVLDDHQLEIVKSENESRLPAYQVGEIWIAGPSISIGYVHSQTASQSTFDQNLSGDLSKYCRTGDLGFIDDLAHLYVVGRLKETLIFRGKNFFLHDIEHHLQHSLQSLKSFSAAAFSIDESEGKIGIVQEIDDSINNYEELFKKIHLTISKAFGLKLVFFAFVAHGCLPRTAIGKIKRREAKEHYYEQHKEAVYVKSLNSNKQSILSTYLKNTIAHLRENKTFSSLIPKEYGGSGETCSEFLRKLLYQANENLDEAVLCLNTAGISLLPLIWYGQQELKNYLLPLICNGQCLLSFAFTESSEGAPSAWFRTHFEEFPDHYEITGEKLWGGASWATHTILFARHETVIKAFVIDLKKPGIQFGRTLDTMGLQLLQQASITFSKCNLSKETELMINGAHLSEQILSFSRLGVSILALGSLNKAISIANRSIAQKTIVTGPLIEHPVIVQRLNRIKTYALLLDHALECMLKLLNKDSQGNPELATLLKAQASSWLTESLQELFFSLGADAYVSDSGFEHLYRSSMGLNIMEGVNDALFSLLGRIILDGHAFDAFFMSAGIQDFAHVHITGKLKKIGLTQETLKNISKNERLFLHYQVGKLLSPLLIALLLHTAPYCGHTVSEDILLLSLKVSEENWTTLPDWRAIPNATHRITQVPTTHNTNPTFTWIQKWCTQNLFTSPDNMHPGSDFFSLGIDSLYAAMFMKAFNSEYHLDLPATLLWDYPIISEFITYIDNQIVEE